MGERYVLTTNTREKCQMMPQKEISPEQGSPHIALVWVQILKEQLFASLLYGRPVFLHNRVKRVLIHLLVVNPQEVCYHYIGFR